MVMNLNFSKLNFTFSKKPLLIGGLAMEYFGLRKSGKDIDLVVCKEDIKKLVAKYPTKLKDLYGDFGVAVYEFEIWKTIRYFDYDYLAVDAIEEGNCLVISLDKLLIQKAIAMDTKKYFEDLKLIVKKITSDQAKKQRNIIDENNDMLSVIDNPRYVERVGTKT
jgi:hypothetical protein